jgi:hypothetical protein
MLPHPAMLGRAPFDYPGLDPFRDPYRLDLLTRDPLREAREREFLRLNPLSSLMNSELERAKAMSSFGYPVGLSGYPGYPASSLPAHKLPPPPHHLSSLYGHTTAAAVPPSLGGLTHPGLTAAHHLGLNGVPGSAAAAAAAAAGPYGKDPLRRS